MASVFIDDLKNKAKKKFEEKKNKQISNQIDIPKYELVDTYVGLVKFNNVVLSLLCVVLGSIGFLVMGYLTMLKLSNTHLYMTNLLELILSSIVVGIVLWGIKSVFEYSIWKGVLSKNKNEELFSIFQFFTIEGMSYISYFLFLPIYIIFYFLFSSYFASLVIGGAICFKFVLMYFSYARFLEKSSVIDRVILIISSILALIFLKLIITFIFI